MTSTIEFPKEETFEIGKKRTFPPIPIPEETRLIFEFCNPVKFKSMSDEELAIHINQNRVKIEKISPWPCLYWYAYLPHSRVSIRNASYPKVYQRIVEDLKSDQKKKFVDMGGLIGHDIRLLIQDGVKPNQIVCADLFFELFELGNELYCDSMEDEHLKGSKFKQVDIFIKEKVDQIRILDGGFHAIYAAKFVHLFSREKQKEILKTFLNLLSKEKGSTIFGADSGRPEGLEGLYDMRANMKIGKIKSSDSNSNLKGDEFFHHSCSSFLKLIKEVINEEGLEEDSFTIQIELRSFDPPKGDGEQMVDPNFIISLCHSLSWSITRN